MKITKKINDNVCNYDDFEIEPDTDYIRIKILENIILDKSERERKKFKLLLLKKLRKLDKNDPLVDDEYLKHLEEAKNRILYVEKYVKKDTIYLKYSKKKLKIHKNVYYKIKNRIIDNSFEKKCNFDTLLFLILNRYNFFDLLNGMSGSINKLSYQKLSKKGFDIEGFSSVYNSNLKYYCGLFPDLEKYFGCIGDVFNIKFKNANVVFNPPFNVKFMNEFFSHISKYILNNNFLFVLPVFKIKHRNILNKICKNKKNTNYPDDYNIELLEIKNQYLYCKENFEYYDYILNKPINYSSTHILTNNLDEKEIIYIFGEYDYKF
jgi:hypothetical protein